MTQTEATEAANRIQAANDKIAGYRALILRMKSVQLCLVPLAAYMREDIKRLQAGGAPQNVFPEPEVIRDGLRAAEDWNDIVTKFNEITAMIKTSSQLSRVN